MSTRKDNEKTDEIEKYCQHASVIDLGKKMFGSGDKGYCATCGLNKNLTSSSPLMYPELYKMSLCIATNLSPKFKGRYPVDYDEGKIRECPFRNPKGFPL